MSIHGEDLQADTESQFEVEIESDLGVISSVRAVRKF